MSVVERARIVRVPNEAQLERALLAPARGAVRAGRLRRRSAPRIRRLGVRAESRPGLPHAAATAGHLRPSAAGAHAGRAAPTTGQATAAAGRAVDGASTRAAGRPSRRRRSAGHRPQLAAQARRARARDAAVCGARRLPGQQHLPGPDHGHAREPARRTRSSPTSSRTSSRSATSRPRTLGPPAGRGLPGHGRPRQRQARRQPRERPRQRHRVDPRVTILESGRATIQVVLDQKVSQHVKVTVVQRDAAPGHRRRRDRHHARDSVVVTGPSSAVNRVAGVAGQRVASTPAASTSTATSSRSPSTTPGEVVTGVELDPAHRQRAGARLHQPLEPHGPGQPDRLGHARRPGFRIGVDRGRPADRLRRGRRGAAPDPGLGRHGARSRSPAPRATSPPTSASPCRRASRSWGRGRRGSRVHIEAVTETRTFTAGHPPRRAAARPAVRRHRRPPCC